MVHGRILGGRPASLARDENVALSVLRGLPDASVLVFDRNLRFILVAGEALARHGIVSEQYENRRCADVLPADRWAVYEPMYRAALAGGTSSIEVDAISRGRRYLVDVGPFRSESGGVVGGMVIARDVTARWNAENQLAQSQRLLHDVLDGLPTGVSVKDHERRFVLVNRAYEKSQRFSRDEVIGKTVRDLYGAEAAEACDAEDLLTLETGDPISAEHSVLLPDGSERTFLIGRSPLRDSEDNVYGICAVATDVSDRTQTERALQEARHLFEQALEHAPIGMALSGLDGCWTRINGAFCEMTGYPREELIEKTFEDITHPEDRAAGVELHRSLVSGQLDDYATENRYVNAKGQTIWARLSVSLVRNAEDDPQYVIAQIQDISDQKLMETRLRHLADHDSLTGLPNRRSFEEKLAIQIGRCQRYGESATLLMLDLDGFKQVNDRYGHRPGDEVLRVVAAAIRREIRATDTAARIGGDEFAVLLKAAGSQATAVAEAIRSAITDSKIELRQGAISPTASIGAAFLDEATGDAEVAFAHADAAMYLDKTQSHRRRDKATPRTRRPAPNPQAPTDKPGT